MASPYDRLEIPSRPRLRFAWHLPEGTRSRTGELQPFHSGIGRLVAQTNVPVLPCHLDGCFRAMPPGRHFSKPGRITVTIAPALRFDEFGWYWRRKWLP